MSWSYFDPECDGKSVVLCLEWFMIMGREELSNNYGIVL